MNKQFKDYSLSPVVLGPASAGSYTPDEIAHKILDIYYDAGGNNIDTAHVYAEWANMGPCTSEKSIGRWIKSRGLSGKVFVASKGGHYRLATPHITRMTRDDITLDAEEAVTNLCVDYLDLYWVHRDNLDMPAGEILEILNDLRKRGVIKHYGASNWTVERLNEAGEYAKAHGIPDFAGVQNMYCLPKRQKPMGDPTCVACEEKDIKYYTDRQSTNPIPLFAYTSQANGFYSKLDSAGVDSLPEGMKEQFLCEENIKKLPLLRELAQKYNCSVNGIGIACLSSINAFDCYPIVNPRTLEQMEDTAKAMSVQLTQDEVTELLNGGK